MDDPDFSSLGGKPVLTPAPGEPDFSSLGGQQLSTPTAAPTATPPITPETDKASGESFSDWMRTPSPPWLQRIEEPVRNFLNQRVIPEIPSSWVPRSAASTVAAANAITGMATPANAVITAAMVAQPETTPFLLPMMMAPIAGSAWEKGKKLIAGTATPEESGQLAADVGMLLAPGFHAMAPKADVFRPVPPPARGAPVPELPFGPDTLPPPPISREFTTMERDRTYQPQGGETNAIQPGNAQIQARGTPLGNEIWPLSSVTQAGVSDNVVRETERAEARGNVQGEEPVTTTEAVASTAQTADEIARLQKEIADTPEGQRPSIATTMRLTELLSRAGEGEQPVTRRVALRSADAATKARMGVTAWNKMPFEGGSGGNLGEGLTAGDFLEHEKPPGYEVATPPPEHPIPVQPKPRTFRQAVDDYGFSEHTPVATYVRENGGLVSKTTAAKQGREGAAALWDDAPQLAHKSHNKIYNPGGEMPDVMAQNLHDAGLLPDPYVDTMYRALESESKLTRDMAKETSRQAGEEKGAKPQIKQADRFGKEQDKLKAKGKEGTQVADLDVGSTVRIGGEDFKVTNFDQENMTVDLEDGSKFGVQTMHAGEIVYGEVTPPGLAKTAPAERPPLYNKPQELDKALSKAAARDEQQGQVVKSAPGTDTVGMTSDEEQLWHLIGKDAYKGSVADVATKELLQNAFDAVRQAGATNEKPSRIDITTDYATRTVSMSDKGVGMTPQTIVDAFLKVGGTMKGTDPSNTSGGHGIAKLQFIRGAEHIHAVTVKDGLKTVMDASAEQIRKKQIPLVKTWTNEPNGTTVTVRFPRQYVDVMSGETKSVWFDENPSFLKKPLLGPVEVYHNGQLLPMGIHATGWQKDNVFNFRWGHVDVYVDPKATTEPKFHVMSAGLHQFDVPEYKIFGFNNPAKINHDMILDVRSDVTSRSGDYPFDNQREGFRGAREKDVEDMFNYLKRQGVEQQLHSAKETFSEMTQLPDVDIEKSLSEKDKREIREAYRGEEKPGAVEEKPAPKKKSVEFTTDKVITKYEGGGQEVRAKDESTFTPEREVDFKKTKMDVTQLDPNKPYFHNNTNVEYGDIHGAPELVASVGNALIKFMRHFGERVGGAYADLAKKDASGWFGGVSFDETYRGLNMVNPFKSIWINPAHLSYVAMRSPEAAAMETMHLFKHEITHVTERNEGSGFTAEFATNDARMVDSKVQQEKFVKILRNIYADHWDAFKELNSRFTDFNTKNKAESFKSGSATGPEPGPSKRAGERISPEHVSGDERLQEQGSTGAGRASDSDKKPGSLGDIIRNQALSEEAAANAPGAAPAAPGYAGGAGRRIKPSAVERDLGAPTPEAPPQAPPLIRPGEEKYANVPEVSEADRRYAGPAPPEDIRPPVQTKSSPGTPDKEALGWDEATQHGRDWLAGGGDTRQVVDNFRRTGQINTWDMGKLAAQLEKYQDATNAAGDALRRKPNDKALQKAFNELANKEQAFRTIFDPIENIAKNTLPLEGHPPLLEAQAESVTGLMRRFTELRKKPMTARDETEAEGIAKKQKDANVEYRRANGEIYKALGEEFDKIKTDRVGKSTDADLARTFTQMKEVC